MILCQKVPRRPGSLSERDATGLVLVADVSSETSSSERGAPPGIGAYGRIAMDRRAFLSTTGASVLGGRLGEEGQAPQTETRQNRYPLDAAFRELAQSAEQSGSYDLLLECPQVDWMVLRVGEGGAQLSIEMIDLDRYPEETLVVPVTMGRGAPSVTVVGDVPYTLDSAWEPDGPRLEPHIWFAETAHVRVFRGRRGSKDVVVLGRRLRRSAPRLLGLGRR